MTGRGGKRRGRPPKSVVMERPKKFQYHLMKKPKYLQNKGTETPSSQPSTPTVSRASSPVESEESRRSTRIKKTRGPRDRHSRKGEHFLTIWEILRLVLIYGVTDASFGTFFGFKWFFLGELIFGRIWVIL